MTEVALFPILLAGIASFVIGYVWYHPRLFGGMWMRLTHVQPENVERGKRQLHISAPVALLASILVAYVMNQFGIAMDVADINGAIALGFWCWVGFVVPTTLGAVIWEHRPLMLYILNAAYWLVAFVAMAIVLLF